MTTATDDLTKIAWHVMDADQRHAWAEQMRQNKHFERYTVAELIEYRNKQHLRDQLQREVSDIEDELATIKDRLCEVEAQLALAENGLRDYQRVIEGAALDRDVHPTRRRAATNR